MNILHDLLFYLEELNPFWTAASIAAALLTLAVMRSKRIQTSRLAVCFTVLYLGLVYNSTVLSRTANGGMQWELMPFWSYVRWMQGDEVFLEYIVLNILMLLPVGYALSFVWWDKWKIVLFGFGFSCLIELSQLLTGRGLCETDDVIHNTAGVALGILIYSVIRKVQRESVHRRQGHGGNHPDRQSKEPPGREESNPPRT